MMRVIFQRWQDIPLGGKASTRRHLREKMDRQKENRD